jgi:hypothetical protein
VTIYTAQIQAKPIAIGESAQDALIGFDAPGAMCVRATSGAIRLEQQLTGQSVIVPQGGDIILNNGALEGLQNTTGHCVCEMQLAKFDPPPPEMSRLATTEEIRQREAEAKTEAKKEPPAPVPGKPAARERLTNSENLPAAEKPSAAEKAPPRPVEKLPGAEKTSEAKQSPVYQVFMPPLAYDARAAVQRDDFDPKLILLVRRVRVRPTLIFQGRVEGNPVGQAVATAKPSGPKPSASALPAQPKDDSVVGRVRAFLRNLFS